MTMVRPTASWAPDSSHALQSLRLPGSGRPTVTISRVSASVMTWWLVEYRCLDHPVGDGRDPEATELAVRLGNEPLAHRQRAETTVLQRRPQFVEEDLDSSRSLNVVGSSSVHPGSARTLVTPHPSPPDQKEGGIGHEVEQVVEPAVRITAGPLVQFGLNPQYPAFAPVKGRFQFVGIHRRNPPGISVSSLLTC
jgi:hypothetical protein